MIIGIAGASASGKSLLANTIVDEIGSDHVVVIPEDSYYKDQNHLSFEERSKLNYDHPEAFDHDLLIQHLHDLQQGKAIDVPIYDFSKHVRVQNVRHVGQHHIVVLEGILLFVEQRLRDLMDMRIYMDTPLDICLTRRLKRDIIERKRDFAGVIEQYQQTVRPMYLQFIEPSKRYADIIVPRGGANRIAIELMKSTMREILGHL